MNKFGAAFLAGLVIVVVGYNVRSTQESPTAQSQAVTAVGGNLSTQAKTITTAVDGTVTWTYPVAYPSGQVPIVVGVAQATFGATDVINVQLDGTPTNTAAKFRVTRTQQSVVALIGLTILSVPASVGATTLYVTARAPT